jgi:hypothetical protein
MSRLLGIIGGISLVLLLSACASTRVTDSWKDPAATPFEFKKVVVIAISSDQSVRRLVEDELARQITRAQAVPAYQVLGDDEVRDVSRVRAKLAEAGFDAAVTFRIIGAKDRVSWQPGAFPGPYYSFAGYQAWAWPAVYDPGYLRTDTYVSAETNVYSLSDGKLLWSGLSETFNPAGIQQLVADVCRAVGKELRKQGLLT